MSILHIVQILCVILLIVIVVLFIFVFTKQTEKYSTTCLSYEQCTSQCGQPKPKLYGMNTSGFDMGDSSTPNEGYACISNEQIDWLKKGGMNFIRMPIIPTRIFTKKPTDDTYNDTIFKKETFLEDDDDKAKCDICSGYYPLGKYMNAVKYALAQDMNVIIDFHDNQNHLDTFGSTITPTEFKNMWSLLAQFLVKNVDNKYLSNIYFELFNEPLGNITNENGNIIEDTKTTDKDGNPIKDQYGCLVNKDEDRITSWNTNYILPTIKEIKNKSSALNIIVTTFGDYSGFHSWADNPCTSLKPLLETIKDQLNDRIFLAAHQYCDENFSGAGNDCTEDFQTKYPDWISKVEKSVTPYTIQVILTEGNVKCPQTCPNGSFFTDFLKDLYKKEWFKGSTVWMSNTGSDFGGTNMGTGCATKKFQFDNYNFYDKTDGQYPDQHYKFSSQFAPL